MRPCAGCGHALPSVGRFCTNCGLAVGATPDRPTPATSPAQPQPQPQAQPRATKASTLRRVLPLVAVGMALALVAGVGALMMLTSGGDKGGDTGGAPTEQSTEPLVTTPISPETPSTPSTTDSPASPTDLAGTATATAPAQAADAFARDGTVVTYAAANMLDAEPTTAWRMNGDGSGQVLTFTFPAPVQLSEVGLINGYAKSDGAFDWYAGNRRVLTADWRFDDGTVATQTFTDTRDLQALPVGPVTTTTVTLTLTAVSPPGTGAASRDFTAISEVALVGTPAP